MYNKTKSLEKYYIFCLKIFLLFSYSIKNNNNHNRSEDHKRLSGETIDLIKCDAKNFKFPKNDCTLEIKVAVKFSKFD